MKTKLTLLLGFLLLVIVWSCRKELGLDETDTEVPADFWAYTPKTIKGETTSGAETHITLLRGMADLKRMKETKAFEKYVSKFGLPRWGQSIEFKDNTGTDVLVLPIGNDSKKSVPALLVVTYAGKYYSYHVISKGKYPKATGKNQGRNMVSENIWESLFATFDRELYKTGTKMGGFKKFVKEKSSGISTSEWRWEYGWMTYWECDDWDWDGDCDCCYHEFAMYEEDWFWYDENGNPVGSEGGGSNGAPEWNGTDCSNLTLSHWLEDIDEMADLRDTHLLFCYADNIETPLLDLILLIPEIRDFILVATSSEGAIINFESLGESVAGLINDVYQAKTEITSCIVAEHLAFETSFWTRYGTFQADQNACFVYNP